MKKLKIGISVVMLTAALTITLLYGGDPATIPDSEESKTLWKCIDCEHEYKLTALEAADEMRKSNGVPLICLKCNEKKVYQPMACFTCQTLFFGSEVPGSTGECPKCLPDAEPFIVEPEEKPEFIQQNPDAGEGPRRVRPKSL